MVAGVGSVLLTGWLTGCASSSDMNLTFFADPGKYQFYSCEQLAKDMKTLLARQQELKSLMDRADQSAGGSAVGLIAYRADYVNAGEELHLLNNEARNKNCEQQEAWRSNAAVR